MVLSFEQVKDVTFGAVDIRKETDGIHFLKCSPSQIDAWYKLRTDLGERAETTTGVTIDFHTNSRHVEFSVIGYKFELLINGVLVQQVWDETPEVEHTISAEFSEGENQITLIFPSHGIGILKSLEVDDGAYITPHQFDKKILFIGDSITQGWDSKFDCMSYAHRVADFYNAERVINGIGGAIYHSATFDKPEFDADIVVIAYGTNDFFYYQTYEEFKEQVSVYLEKIKSAYSDKKVFVVTPIWRSDDDRVSFIGTFGKCRETIKKESKRLGLIVVDGYHLVPHFDLFYADIVHPNDLGFVVYAQNLIAKMNEYLV